MKIIYSSPEKEFNKILVLSLEGLNYTTSFTSLDQEQTHIPMFEDKEYFYLADCKFQSFHPTKCVYGFRYQKEDGEMSGPYTAVFCTINGEEAVILGSYAQSHADDEFDNMSPYSDCYGVWKFWSRKPSFYGEINPCSHAVDSEGVRRSYATPKLRNIRYDIKSMAGVEVYEYSWDCKTQWVRLRTNQDGQNNQQ